MKRTEQVRARPLEALGRDADRVDGLPLRVDELRGASARERASVRIHLLSRARIARKPATPCATREEASRTHLDAFAKGQAALVALVEPVRSGHSPTSAAQFREQGHTNEREKLEGARTL